MYDFTDFLMELFCFKVYLIIFLCIEFVTNLDTIQEENSKADASKELADTGATLERTNSFGLPVLKCENNICSLHVEARIPFTSITVAGKMIVGYDVVTENTVSGEGRLMYTNNSTGKAFTLGLKLSIALEGVDELEMRLDVICGKDERTFSFGGKFGTDLPALCSPMPATPMYFMFCLTIGDYKYFNDDRLIICIRAEIQFCQYRVITLLYKCLNFSKNNMKAINHKLKTVSSFSKSQYVAAKQTLKSIPSFRQNSFKAEENIRTSQQKE